MTDIETQDCFCSSAPDPDNLFNFMDRWSQAQLAKITGGISPAGLRTSYFSWAAQLMQSPGRCLQLALSAGLYPTKRSVLCNDVRFHSEHWQNMPWRMFAENFMSVESWWRLATEDIPGLSAHTEKVISFVVRQGLDAWSPANFIFTNPELFYETYRSSGKNILHGTEVAIKDSMARITGTPPEHMEDFIPGKQVAITPGRVIFCNHLIELIQYDAQTTTVYKEPILILPAWIMKYYILDLSPNNSMVDWLVKQGHTVFMVSWRNPTREDRDLAMDDYYRLGAMTAIDMVAKQRPKTKIHLMGYCLGGTLALITAAAMAQHNNKRLQSLTLLAAQGDFTEAGELMLFINKSELSFLENMMWEQGYLDTKQMAGSFQMLRSYDLIWSKIIHDYMHVEKSKIIDLLAWNADATRMPYKMHSEYLEKFFLRNDFVAGRLLVENQIVVAENIRVPAFVVSTEKDHVAPWHSVYKTHLMLRGPITFVLTSGGHNAGIISEPGHPGRTYRIHSSPRNSVYKGPDQWYLDAEQRTGSWWLEWSKWLADRSSILQMQAPDVDTKLPMAPGDYVLQK